MEFAEESTLFYLAVNEYRHQVKRQHTAAPAATSPRRCSAAMLTRHSHISPLATSGDGLL